MISPGALQSLDLIVAAAVEEPPRDDPPESAVEGACYIVGVAPVNDWSGEAGSLALRTTAGWRFARPVEGMQALVKSLGVFAVYRSGAWEVGDLAALRVLIGGKPVLGPRGAAIASPTGGTFTDIEAREAIAAILSAMRAHGLIETE